MQIHSEVNFNTRVCIGYLHLMLLVKKKKRLSETDASESEALGKLLLINLTQAHQRVSTLPHKHTHAVTLQ